MGNVEWYRRTTWTPADRADFEAHLRRSRSEFHKAQYLRIQAIHLHAIGKRKLTQAALELVDRLITDFPDPSELAAAHTLRAECLQALGHAEASSLAAYDAALAQQRAFPSVRDDAYLGFGELVVSLRRSDLYDQALKALADFGGHEVFPVLQYRSAAIRALIASDRGERDAARDFARQALHVAGKSDSGMPYHKNLGLVATTDSDIYKRLKKIGK